VIVKVLTLQLETGKTVKLSGFRVSGSSTVCFWVRFVELDINVEHCPDFSGLEQWLTENPGKTWRDYLVFILLPIYDRFSMAKNVKDKLEAASTEEA